MAPVGALTFNLGNSSGRCVEEESRTYGAKADNATSIIYSLDSASLSRGLELFSEIGTIEFPPSYFGTATITASASNVCSTSDSVARHIIRTAFQEALPDRVRVYQNETVIIEVLKNDICDIDTATLSVVSQPQHGNVLVDNVTGLISYTPDLNYTGTDSFVYRFCGITYPDTCSSATVSI